MYRVRILESACRELEQLDKPTARRVVERVRWLAANLHSIRPEALKSDLKGFYKLRVGDYRIIYEVLDQERVIIIHAIGHRRDIYRKR
jgi:mRNA interferase RelE/StbE